MRNPGLAFQIYAGILAQSGAQIAQESRPRDGETGPDYSKLDDALSGMAEFSRRAARAWEDGEAEAQIEEARRLAEAQPKAKGAAGPNPQVVEIDEIRAELTRLRADRNRLHDENEGNKRKLADFEKSHAENETKIRELSENRRAEEKRPRG